MKRSVATILAVAGFAACFDDPTSALRGGASRVRLSLARVFVAPQESVTVSGTLLDDQGNPVPGTLSCASADANVATAGDLPGDTVPGLLESSGYVVGQLAGATYVRVTSSGVSDSIYVVVVPVAFTGTVAPAAANVGDTITLTAPASITFDTANASVTVNGADAIITAASTTQVRFVSPAATGGTVTVGGLVLLGSIDVPPLDATTTVNVTDAGEPANDAFGTAPAMALPTAVGSFTEVYGSVTDGSDVDDILAITTTTADSLEFVLDWPNGSIDIDMYVLDAAGTLAVCGDDFIGCSAATGSDPESGSARLAASTTYKIYVNLFDAGGEPTPAVYRLRIYKRG